MIAIERKQNSILNNHSATVKHDCQISLKNSSQSHQITHATQIHPNIKLLDA